MAGQIYQDKNLNNKSLTEVGSIQITGDAAQADHAVRKSQAEQIADTTTQTAIVDNLASPNESTAPSTQLTKSQLDTKQGNLSIAADSTLFLSLDNDVLSFSNLGRGKILKDETSTDFAAFLATVTFDGGGIIDVGGEKYDAGTQIFLTASTNAKETVYIYVGTNNGDASDFINDSDKYDASEVRQLLSATGIGLLYDSNTGVFSISYGTGAQQLGGQNVDHGATFTTITPNAKINDALQKLETLIIAVDQSGADGTAALTALMNNRDGVTGVNYETFTGNLLSDNKNAKQLYQEIEVLLQSAIDDRAAIRSEMAAGDAALQTNINSEAAARASADSTLQTNINNEATTRAGADAGLQANITNEAITRASADSTLQSNIDLEESARISADNTLQANISAEATARTNADDALQSQIDSLADSNIELVGTVDGSGVFTSVDGAGDSRNGQNFVDIGMKAGEEVVFSADVTLLSNDFKTNDKLMVKVATIVAGQMQLSDFVYKKGDGSDLTRANLGSSTVDLNGSDQLRVTPDSVERAELGPTVKAELDDTVSLTADNQVMTGKALSILQSDDSTAASFGLHLKKTQTGSGALTGTARALLVENFVETNGSGNAGLPSYAHNSLTTHYDGSCVDLSVVVSGAYCEANAKANTAVNAVGAYAVATDVQLGVNVGLVALADNASTSNVAALAYAFTDGAGPDRGVVAAVSNLTLEQYQAARLADPFPYDDIGLVVDAKYAPAGTKGLYSYGDAVFEGGTVSVPSATIDASAVNLGDIKGKQAFFEMDTTSAVTKTFASGLDLSNGAMYQVIHSGQAVDVDVQLNTSNDQISATASEGNLSGLQLIVIEMSVAKTVIN